MFAFIPRLFVFNCINFSRKLEFFASSLTYRSECRFISHFINFYTLSSQSTGYTVSSTLCHISGYFIHPPGNRSSSSVNKPIDRITNTCVYIGHRLVKEPRDSTRTNRLTPFFFFFLQPHHPQYFCTSLKVDIKKS